MRLTFDLPNQIAMVASASYIGGEGHPTVTLAIYRNGFDPGDSDGRLAGESEFGHLRVRQFFPGSGCGMSYDNNRMISYAEPGLQNFVDKKVSWFYPDSKKRNLVLVVWEGEEDFSLLEAHRHQLTWVINGLSQAFA